MRNYKEFSGLGYGAKITCQGAVGQEPEGLRLAQTIYIYLGDFE